MKYDLKYFPGEVVLVKETDSKINMMVSAGGATWKWQNNEVYYEKN